MSFTVITVTRSYLNEDGTAAAGTVQFQLNQPIANSGVTRYHTPLTVTLNASGQISVPLVANNDPATTPQGSFYVVIERVTSASNREYTVIVPYNAEGATVDLGTLEPGHPGFG